MDTILLKDKESLDIFVNPQRQNILRCMKVAGTPLTPKQIADTIGISASSVTHHLKKLCALGVVQLSHTAQVRGITASYYTAPPVTVSYGLGTAGQDHLRMAALQNNIAGIMQRFTDYCLTPPPAAPGTQDQHGDFLSGILHLSPAHTQELYALIRRFIDEHETPATADGAATAPWEYALVFLPAQGSAAP